MNFREIFYFLDTLKYAHERVVEYQIKLSPHRFSFKRRSEKSGDIRGSLVPIIGTLGQKLKSICLEYHTRQCMIVSSGLKLATSRNEPTKLWEGNVSSRVCLSTGGPMWPSPRMHRTSLYRPLRPLRPCPPSPYRTSPCLYIVPWSLLGQDWKRVQTWFSWGPPCTALPQCWHLVDAYWNMCGGQAGIMHPNGMFSCLESRQRTWIYGLCS